MKPKKIINTKQIEIWQDRDKSIELGIIDSQLKLECRVTNHVCEEEGIKPGTKLILKIKKSKESPKYQEAKFYKTNPAGRIIPAETMPGFFAAESKKDLHLDKIIERSSDYITKEIEKVGKSFLTGYSYEIKNIQIKNVKHKKEGTFADIELEINRYEEILAQNLSKSWTEHIFPQIIAETKSIGQKAELIFDLRRKIANNFDLEQVNELAESLNLLNIAMTCAYQLPEIYQTEKERSGYSTNKAETTDSKLKNAARITIQNLHETVFLDPTHTEGITLQELSGRFENGKPYKIILENQRIIYE